MIVEEGANRKPVPEKEAEGRKGRRLAPETGTRSGAKLVKVKYLKVLEER